MTKKFLAIALAATAIVWAADPVADYIDLFDDEYLQWDYYIDDYGEGTKVNITNQNPLTVTMTLSDTDEDKIWPYAGVDAFLDVKTMATLEKIEITYTASKEILVGILTTLKYYGENVIYYAKLSSGTNKTVTLNLSDFKVPEWMVDDGYTGPADLSSVSKNNIESDIEFTHEHYNQSITVTVTSIKLYGLEWWDGDDTNISSDFTDENFRAAVYNYIGKPSGSPIFFDDIKYIDYLNVSRSNITSLAGIEHLTALTRLDCSGNNLTTLDISKNTKLNNLDVRANHLENKSKIIGLDETSLYQGFYFDPQKNATDTDITNKFTDLDFRARVYNNIGKSAPALIYDNDVIGITNFYVTYSNITSLAGIEYFLSLQELYCYNNHQLTTLDVSKNINLSYLDCDDNKLTSLILPDSDNLRYLYCRNNELTSLDVAKNTILQYLICSNNSMTTLDLSKNTNLSNLDVRVNYFEDESKIIGLKEWYYNYYYFYPQKNLSATDITNKFTDPNFKAAVYDYIGKSAPAPIYDNDVMGIISLDVSYSDITSLAGIEYFPLIEILSCRKNNLTTLDLSNNTNLKYLNCSYNQLTTLNVSSNTNLWELGCSYNQLTTLDVSSNTNLWELGCSYNQLTTLDVSKNTNLSNLDCYNNQLTTLDLSNNTYLWELYCYDNFMADESAVKGFSGYYSRFWKQNPAAPAGLTAKLGQTLANVELPTGWSWADATTTSVGNAGTQTFKANFAGDDNYYNSAANISVNVSVAKTKITKPTATNTSFVYTGSEQSLEIAANAAYNVSGDKGTNAGNYNATVILADKTNYEWTDGTTADIPFSWTIAKASYNMDGITFAPKTVTYDGNTHSIEISGDLHTGVSVSYIGNGKTAIGTHEVTAMFSVTDQSNYNVPEYMTATLTINDIASPIEIKRNDGRNGIRLSNNIVSDKAVITIDLPNGEKVSQIKTVIYDNIGNVVFETETRSGKVEWNLTNNVGRNVANGTYLIVAEARGNSGKAYKYSAKLGVRR